MTSSDYWSYSRTMKEIFPRIVVDKGVAFGKPVIDGTRVPVAAVIGHIAAGDAVEDVAKEYGITKEQVFAALKYAAKVVDEEMVVV